MCKVEQAGQCNHQCFSHDNGSATRIEAAPQQPSDRTRGHHPKLHCLCGLHTRRVPLPRTQASKSWWAGPGWVEQRVSGTCASAATCPPPVCPTIDSGARVLSARAQLLTAQGRCQRWTQRSGSVQAARKIVRPQRAHTCCSRCPGARRSSTGCCRGCLGVWVGWETRSTGSRCPPQCQALMVPPGVRRPAGVMPQVPQPPLPHHAAQ
mmetsp:Transcript_2915/g.7571  ORF Transcript_2915/g.7571 Transcript_2915/m.7571 type:complete len:208 (-) Transcript_2915:1226-1849(-)